MDLFCGDDREQQIAYITRTLERDFKDVSLCRWLGGWVGGCNKVEVLHTAINMGPSLSSYSVENSSNGLIFREKWAENGHLFSQKTGAKWAKFELFKKKQVLLSFAFPFFLAVFTVLQVHPKTRLSITWPW